MRKLWPYLGIALAVAVGITLAPYAWWLLALAAVAVVWAQLSIRARAIALWLLVASIFVAWAAWLESRGQTADAVFVGFLFVLACTWPRIVRRARAIIR